MKAEVVFLDVGGPIYDDVWYGRALLQALRELGAEVEEDDFWQEVDRLRSIQAGMTEPLTRRFLGPDADRKAVAARAKLHWRYPPDALYADVLPTLERDGVAPFIDVWVVSDEVGLAKPDPEFFAYAVRAAGYRPEQAVFVGNRLDNDIRPAHATGLRTVWILRGEAPPHPTHEQLAEPDAVISALAELPAALERLGVAA